MWVVFFGKGVGQTEPPFEKPEGWPIVIEAEVGNHRQADVLKQDLASATHSSQVGIKYTDPLPRLILTN